MDRIVFGVNPVVELLRSASEPVEELLLAAGRKSGRLQEILALARAAGVRVRRHPRPELDRLAAGGVHQGVVARVGEFVYAQMDQLLERPGVDLIVLLDGLEDPRNLGAIARTALGAGAGGLIIPKDRACPVTPAAVKASAGALAHLGVARVTNLNRTAESLKEKGFWLVGATPRAEASLYDLPDLPPRLAVAIGAESKGLSRALSQKCDFLVSLPLDGPIDSLNASAAAAVVLFEIKRRRIKEDLRSSRRQ